jgi:hypothetical protein
MAEAHSHGVMDAGTSAVQANQNVAQAGTAADFQATLAAAAGEDIQLDINTPGEQLLASAMESGLLEINGPYAEQAFQMYASLADSNPEIAQSMFDRFQSGQPLTINTDNVGGPPSPTTGYSNVNAIGGDTINLNFGDGPIGGEGGMLTIAAHEWLHIMGLEHGEPMFAATDAATANVLNGNNFRLS